MGIFIGIKALSWWSWCPDYPHPALTEVINSVLATWPSTERGKIRRKMLILALTERTHFKNEGHRNLNITSIKSLSHRAEEGLEMDYSMQVRNGLFHAGQKWIIPSRTPQPPLLSMFSDFHGIKAILQT